MTTSTSLETVDALKHYLYAQALNDGPLFFYFRDSAGDTYVAWFSDPKVYNHGLNAPLYSDIVNSPRWNSLFCYYRFDGDDGCSRPVFPVKILDGKVYIEPNLAFSLRNELIEELGPLGAVLPPDGRIYRDCSWLDLTGAHVKIHHDDTGASIVFSNEDAELGVPLPEESIEYFQHQVIKVVHAYLRTVL